MNSCILRMCLKAVYKMKCELRSENAYHDYALILEVLEKLALG